MKIVKCKKKLVDKLVEECTENVEKVKLAKIPSTEDKNKHKCSSCTLHIVLLSIMFTLELVLISFTRNTWIAIKKNGAQECFNYQATFNY